MSRATDAYAVLTAALDNLRPNCLNDPRFITDSYPASELEPVCDNCPAFDPCHGYASIAKPAGGFWAGRRWKGNT